MAININTNKLATKALKRTKNSYSRYKNTPYEIDDDGNCFMMENDFIIMPDASDDTFYVPREFEGRPDLISNACYNNPMYAWVIMQRNSIIDPFSIKTMMKLYIPSLDRIIKLFYNT